MPNQRQQRTTTVAAPATPSSDVWDFSVLAGLTVNDTPVIVPVPTARPNAASLAQVLDALGTSSPTENVTSPLPPVAPAAASKKSRTRSTTSRAKQPPQGVNAPSPRPTATHGGETRSSRARKPSVTVETSPDVQPLARPSPARPALTGSEPLASFLVRPSADAIVIPPVAPEPVITVPAVPIPVALPDQRGPATRAQRGQASVATWTDGAWRSASPEEKRHARRVLWILVGLIALVLVAVGWAARPSAPVTPPAPMVRMAPAVVHPSAPAATHTVVPTAARAAPRRTPSPPVPAARREDAPPAPALASPIAGTAPSGAVAVSAATVAPGGEPSPLRPTMAHRKPHPVPHATLPASTPVPVVGKPYHLDAPVHNGLAVA